MIGYRQLLVILCSMFLMLGIGIILGALANFGPAVTRQQSDTINKLAHKLDIISSESDRDGTMLHGDDDALKLMSPEFVKNKLAGKRYAIIQTGDYPAAVRSAVDAISAAGGTVVSQTVILPKMVQIDDDRIHKIAQSLTVPLGTNNQSSEGVHSLLRPLVFALGSGSDNLQSAQTDLNTLASNDFITLSGDYSKRVSGVVVVAGASDDSLADPQSGMSPATQIDNALFADFTDIASSLSVVGCEPFDTVKSSIPDFTAAGLSSVDCIDQPLGSLDIVYALRNNDGTAYGLKNTASDRAPGELAPSITDQAAPPSVKLLPKSVKIQ